MPEPTLTLEKVIAVIDAEIATMARWEGRAKRLNESMEWKAQLRYAQRTLRLLRHEIYQTAGIDEEDL